MLQSALHWLGFGLCHQLPGRSFFGGGVQVSVCARDTGIYVGFVVSLVLLSLLHRGRRPREFPRPLGWAVLMLMIGSMALDGGTEYLGLRGTTNELRLITGLMSGFAIAALLVPMLNDVVWRTGSCDRLLDPAWKIGVWLSAVPVCYAAVWWVFPLLGVAYPIIVALCILATLTAVNLVMVCILPFFERKAERLLEAWPAIAVAFCVGLGEIWLAGALRLALIKWATGLG